jgi:hypothetical protein
MSAMKSSIKGKNGFFMLSNSFIDDGTLASLSNSALRVYLVIFRLSNSAKSVAFPSYTAIMKSSGLKSRSGVSSGIKELESRGIITKITKGSNLNKQANTYRVNNTATIVAGVNQTQLAKPVGQIAVSGSMPASTASNIAFIDGMFKITGIEEIDIKLTEAYNEDDHTKANMIISSTQDGMLPPVKKLEAYKSLKELFKK